MYSTRCQKRATALNGRHEPIPVGHTNEPLLGCPRSFEISVRSPLAMDYLYWTTQGYEWDLGPCNENRNPMYTIANVRGIRSRVH